MQSKYLWHQGKFCDYQAAQIHVLTSSLHYGTAVFEGIRSYKTNRGVAVFRLKDHIQRLIESASLCAYESPYSFEVLYQAVLELLALNRFEDAYIRPIIYVVDGGWNLLSQGVRLECSIAAWKWDKYMGEEALEKGINAKISSFRRQSIQSSFTQAKAAGNYLNSTLARSEAHSNGADEAILLDINGFVSECSGQNLFIRKNDKVVTPHAYSLLPGITRDTVMKLLANHSLTLTEDLVTRDQLYLADEVFMVGTANEIIGITKIDHRCISKGTCGEFTRLVQKEYQQLVRGQNRNFLDFLDFVPNSESLIYNCDESLGAINK